MQHLLRKQIILLVALLSISLATLAQTDEVYQPYHDDYHVFRTISLGFTNDYLNFDRGFKFKNDLNEKDVANWIIKRNNPSFIMGINWAYGFNNHFLIRAGANILVSGKKNVFNFAELSRVDTQAVNISSVIINFPLIFKIQSDRYNFFKKPDMMRHYILLGPRLDIDMSRFSDDTKGLSKLGGQPLETSYPKLLKIADYGYEIGMGLSFYLNFVTVSPELRFSYGLSDIKGSNHILTNLDKITNNHIYFTINFENF